MKAKHLWSVNHGQCIDVIKILSDRGALWDCVFLVEVKASAEHRVCEPNLQNITTTFSSLVWSCIIQCK